MNRIFSTLIIGLALVLPASVFASTVNLSPTTVSVTPGKVFTVQVMANPNGAHVYTVRANISFNPALVQVTNFTFAPKWLALSTSGYDVTNNTTGSLIKTAGYPGGITSSTAFGAITFKAKAMGSVHIAVTNKSLVLDANSKNTVSGTQGSSVVTVAIPPTPKPTVKAPVKKTIVPTHKTVVKKEAVAKPIFVKATTTTSTATGTKIATTGSGTTTLPLQASASASGGRNAKFIFAILAIVVIGVILWINRKRFLR